MDSQRNQPKLHIPERHYLGTTPANNTTASDMARTKLENIYEQAEQGRARGETVRNAPDFPARNREDVIKIIDQTPGDQIPRLSQPAPSQPTPNTPKPAGTAETAPPADQTFTVRKSHLDTYHKEWQKYYQKYYENYYTENLKQEVTKVKKQKLHGALTKIATKKHTPQNSKEATRRLHHEVIYRAKKTVHRAKSSRHFKPILAGLIAATIVALIQFNQLITGAVAAFVAPSDDMKQPLLVSSIEDVAVGPDNMLVIPKLGLESPLVFDAKSASEEDMQAALEYGVVHYNLPNAHSLPGEKGNSVYLGHSSGDIFYGGNFKYIFSKLNRLAAGDTFYINYNSKRYIYSIDRTEVILPDQLDKLYINDGNAWVTLVTCDPPGSSAYRLLIYAKQISPDPNSSDSSDNQQNVNTPKNITGKTPTLFERIFGF
jgi:sortase A